MWRHSATPYLLWGSPISALIRSLVSCTTGCFFAFFISSACWAGDCWTNSLQYNVFSELGALNSESIMFRLIGCAKHLVWAADHTTRRGATAAAPRDTNRESISGYKQQ